MTDSLQTFIATKIKKFIMEEDKITAIATTALRSSHHWLRHYRRTLQERCLQHQLCDECIDQDIQHDDDDDELTTALKASVRKMTIDTKLQIHHGPQIDFVSTVPTLPHPPKVDSALSAGIDLYPSMDGDITILPHSRYEISTGLRCYMPEGYFGDIRPRSGLAKHGCIMVLAGVVDPGYRGEITVWLFNPTTEPFTIKAGTAVAQMVLTKYCSNVSVVVDGKRNPEPQPRTHHRSGMGYIM